ncbi:MAG: hypothetical protein ACKPKO_61105, partial [Candidatus Fonsibacter sp.]
IYVNIHMTWVVHDIYIFAYRRNNSLNVYIYICWFMYCLPELSTVEYNVDDLGRKADFFNAVLYGITTIYGLAVLNGPVTLSSNRYQRCVWITDSPRPKGSVCKPLIYWYHGRHNEGYDWTWQCQ